MNLIAFGLPATFPPDLVPPEAAQFVRDTHKGMALDSLLQLAKSRGYAPIWKPLPHIGPNIFGLGLSIDGLEVPFMVKMDISTIAKDEHLGGCKKCGYPYGDNWLDGGETCPKCRLVQ